MNCSLKHFAGVENAMRLKSCLDATHQLEPEAVDDEELRLGELRYYGPTASASRGAVEPSFGNQRRPSLFKPFNEDLVQPTFDTKRTTSIRELGPRYNPQPVTATTWPVMPAAAGETRKTTVSAISSRVVQRFRSFGFIAAMLDAVSTSPGAIAFTRMPRSLPSSASVRVSASIPAFAQLYATI